MARRQRWMWAETADLLDQAERLQQQFFRLATAAQRAPARWEPPVDVYVADAQALIEVALPGVPEDRIDIVLGPGELVIRGVRQLPKCPPGGSIQRLEIPYGRFERRLVLGPGTWELVDQNFADGCLRLLLARRG